MVTIHLIPAMGHDKELFRTLIEICDETFKVITHNYPQELSEQDDTLEFLAQYFSKEIRKTNHLNEKYILLGVSLGASLCLRINEILENEAENLFLLATGGPRVARIRKEMILNALKESQEKDFVKRMLSLDSEENFLSHFCENQDSAAAYYAYLAKSWENATEQVLKQFIDLSKAAIEIDYEHLLSHFQSKIIILWGDKDKVFSKRNLSKIIDCAPEATIVRFKNFGHYLPIEAPQEVIKIVSNYV